MGWIVFVMTSLALWATGACITRMFAEPRVRRAAGLMVNALWLAFAGFAFWSFKAPAAAGSAPGFCATGWAGPRVGAPLAWRNPVCRAPVPVEAQVAEPVAAPAGMAIPGAEVFGDFGPMTLDLLLWAAPVLVFWSLLHLRRDRTKP